MRVNHAILDKTWEATADLSALQWTFVKVVTGVSTGPQARVSACGAGEQGYILQNRPKAAGLGAVIRIYGFSELIVDGGAGAIAPGDYLASDSSGRGVKTVADHAKYNAIAFEASTATGDRIEVLCERGFVSL